MLTHLWTKSSYSQGGHANCLEARLTDNATRVHLRDSHHRHLAQLGLPTTEWTAFLHAATRGAL